MQNKQESFVSLPDLAARHLGGMVLVASDEFFAQKENLLNDGEPVWDADAYTDRGKWMDGWESRRKRVPGYDWAVVRLGLPGLVRGVLVDTAYFTGNFPESCSIDGCWAPDATEIDDLLGREWIEILPNQTLQGNSKHYFPITCPRRLTHVRLNIFPDGGVARLRVHGNVLPSPATLSHDTQLDLVSLLYGGEIVSVSDAHYGPPHNLLLPTRGVNMKDGWETKRRRGPGHDWAIIRLACSGVIRRAIVDTSHFKGNYPESCSIETCSVTNEADLANENVWKPLLERTKLRAHFEHLYTEDDLLHQEPATHVRLKSFPDGGISRLRLFGELSEEGRKTIGLRRLNAMWPQEAKDVFLSICKSNRWAEQMVEARPFVDVDALQEKAQEFWDGLDKEDWLEAFAGHPRIGQKKAATEQSEQSHSWSKQEQSSMDTASDDVQTALQDANDRYFEKFGYIFIVCATGKSPQEMLDILNGRLPNDADTELPIAAGEQAKITALRLEKWLVA